jgi:predicted Fe-S protein YdhL (DUF1289 family)
MKTKLIVALALSLGMGSAAFAQTVNSTTGEVNVETPAGWQGPIGDAFYSDMEAGTLRSQEEMTANWANLTTEQQTQVKTDCDAMAAGPQTETKTGDVATAETTDDNPTASTNSMAANSMSDICGMVGSM